MLTIRKVENTPVDKEGTPKQDIIILECGEL